ncbi:hypothetical protein BDZ91DRAFT_473107 [Kalaharituber pfeilii]|nr:hypothetical protein BDZ91DRAFT_473107 [Kalaharituber pfeilii]
MPFTRKNEIPMQLMHSFEAVYAYEPSSSEPSNYPYGNKWDEFLVWRCQECFFLFFFFYYYLFICPFYYSRM